MEKCFVRCLNQSDWVLEKLDLFLKVVAYFLTHAEKLIAILVDAIGSIKENSYQEVFYVPFLQALDDVSFKDIFNHGTKVP